MLPILRSKTFLVRFSGILGDFGDTYMSKTKMPMASCRDQTSLICCRSVPITLRLVIYRTQIRRPSEQVSDFLDLAGYQYNRQSFWSANCEFGLIQIRDLQIGLRVRDWVRVRLFNSSFQASHYHNTYRFHPMSYSLYLKPTWRTRALETSLVWN